MLEAMPQGEQSRASDPVPLIPSGTLGARASKGMRCHWALPPPPGRSQWAAPTPRRGHLQTPGPAGIAPLVFSSGATLRLRDRHTHRQVPRRAHDSPRGEAPNMSLGDKTRGRVHRDPHHHPQDQQLSRGSGGILRDHYFVLARSRQSTVNMGIKIHVVLHQC